MTDAKRHHVVPRVLLRRFSPEPATKNPAIWRLDKESGRVQRTSVNNETVIGYYYRIEQPTPGLKTGSAEETLSRIESEAAEPIRKLVDGQPLTEAERVWMAFFLQVQRQRTPEVRGWHADLEQQLMTEVVKTQLSSPEGTRRVLRDQGDQWTDEEIEQWRVSTLFELETGQLLIESGQDRQVAHIFAAADKMVAAIAYLLTWHSLRAPANIGFICSDQPLLLYDQKASARPPMHQGVGWMSSNVVEASLPLDPKVCLLLRPGPATWRMEEANESIAADLNLRTYASAQRFIYGSSQKILQDVREHAKQARARVASYRPSPPQFTLFEQVEGKPDARTAKIHRPSRSVPVRRKG